MGGVDFSKIIDEIRARNKGSENVFAKAAAIIQDEISKPILNRIAHRRAAW
jgi:hypothetical protein